MPDPLNINPRNNDPLATTRMAMADVPPEVPPSGRLPPGKTAPAQFLTPTREPGGAPTARQFTPEQPRVATTPMKVSDDGTAVHLQPPMQVPKGQEMLSWGMKAYRTNYGGQPVLQIRDTRIPENLRGTGVGMQMYEHIANMAAKEGRALHSDGTVTEDAANRWLAMNRAGRNVVMHPQAKYYPGYPFGRFMTPDGSAVFRIEDPSGNEAK